MAALIPDFQAQLDLRNGKVLLVTKVTLASSSDTITIPDTANDTNGTSVAQLRDVGEAAVTLTQADNTLTIAGKAGGKVTIVSLHGHIHSGLEANPS